MDNEMVLIKKRLEEVFQGFVALNIFMIFDFINSMVVKCCSSSKFNVNENVILIQKAA